MKKKRTFFKVGNIPHNKGVRYLSDNTSPAAACSVTRRMDADTVAPIHIQQSASGGLQTLAAPDCDGASGSARMLRPRLPVKENGKEVNDNCGTRMIDASQNVKMWNDIVYRHQKQEIICERSNFQIARERKWGLAWKQTMLCTNCGFRSPEYKLYKETHSSKPGPKAAAINQMFQAGLQDTPIGNTRASYLLAATDIVPPSRSCMYRTANIVGKATIELNERDMADKLKLVHDINVMRGAEDPQQIDVAFDARYNAIRFGHDKKPGQSSSQAVGIACETVTEQQYIVGALVENKLCWVGAWLQGQHFNVQCPGGHFDCTANLLAVAPHSEYEMAKAIGAKFAQQKILIKHATTDGDAKAAAGFNDAYSVLYPMWEVERLSDPTHLGRSQFKRCNSATFSEVLKMRLSCDAVHRLRFNTSTQKCEAVNKSISVSLPKNVNYTRNFEARVHSTIHRLNNKLGESLKAKVKHLGGELSRRTLKSLHQMEKDNIYHRLYKKRPATRRRILERHGNMIQAHLKYRMLASRRNSDYRKSHLDTEIKGDHSYAQV